VSTLALKAVGFFWLPLPVLGVAPWAIYLAYGINLVYQFFVHTEMIGKLPRPVELAFNTPSHHRVHHGSDAIYLDRNYAELWQDVRYAASWRDRLGYLFRPPEWRPASSPTPTPQSTPA
jgi:hypothetical protein